MGCRKGCGSSIGNIELIVKDLIRQMIDDGKLQEGLIDCNDKRLWHDTRVITCDILADAVCQLADDGALCFREVEGIVVDDNQICLVFNDGTKACTTAKLEDTFIESGKVNGTTLVLSNNKGETIEVDLAAALKTIKATVEETSTGYTVTGTDGVVVTIPKIAVKAEEVGDNVVITNQDGTTVSVPAVVNVNAVANNNGTVTITNQDGTTVTTQEHRATVELVGLFNEEVGFAHAPAEGGDLAA